MTLAKGQGHNLFLKVGNYPFLKIFDNISDTIYWFKSYNTWPTGSLWGDLKNDMTLSDLGFGQGHNVYLKVGKYPFGIILDNRPH